MEITKIEYFEDDIECIKCNNEECDQNASVLMELGYDEEAGPIVMCICDDCLQELNRKIVENLAEKNI